MLTESEIRTAAQDAQIGIRAEMDSLGDSETPIVWTGRFLVLGQLASDYPWNADSLFKRSFPASAPFLVLEFDHSVPGAGFSAWYAYDARLEQWCGAEDVTDLLGL